MQTARKKTALVTGGSSGIGRCTAAALRDAGCTVYEFSRRDIPMEGVHHMSVDVTDEAAVQAAVELGDIHTGFTRARQKVALGDEEYGGRISRSVSQMEKDEQNGMAPEVIGAYIARIAQKKSCAPICVAGAQYKFLSLLCKLLPCTLRGKIVGSIYAK